MLINYIQSLFRRLVIFAANLFVITFQKTTELRAIIFLVVLSSFLCYLFSLGILFVDDYNSYDAFAIKNTFQDNNVTPPGINHPPVANAGQNQIVNESNIVTLNGLASDPDPNDEGKLVYLWKQLSGPGVNLSNNTSPNPSFTAPMVSSDRELRFSVIAIDENGATSKPTNVIITVKHLNLPPIAKAGENQTISPGDVVTLDGSKSSDPENDPLRYSWIQTSGPRVKLGGTTNSIASFTVPSNISSETDLIFALTVADSRNASSIDNVKITSRPAPSFNKPPVTNAGEDMMVNAGEIVKLNGTWK